MIRGALIFATGLVLGYAKAVSETEAINQTVNNIVVKAKEAWDEASTDEPTPDEPENVDDLRRQLGIEFLMKRLHAALPYAKVSDETPIIRGEGGEAVLTMGDLRAPFPNLNNTTHTQGQGESAS